MTLGNLYTKADFTRYDSGGAVVDTNPATLVGGQSCLVTKLGGHRVHCLNDWTISVQITGHSADIISLGLVDIQFAGTHPTWFNVDATNHTMSMYQDAGTYHIKTIQPGFNYANYTLTVHYCNNYAVMLAKDSNGYIATNRIRYNFLQHAGNSIGSFAMRATGTASIGLGAVQVSSAQETGADFLFVGDSITLGRKNFPESNRFADR
ncbi:MAG: hypothetical protein JST36_07495, partial [Bacteroidetes bacterium]|nr:hypothetical protein [Bacteroidota bacterium]